ncbi:uncharacterized protein APUU_20371S [Aspergillus puulaauensis]|uniref:FAD-binding PCMH-type domain-containing protein n=1 Tax=Aspergillus puulaauensis TaxID=1220207 RepID=A0A7R7XEM1_9EURO|nr:uncharacterized protein APUU_20371S [Aspergillus puulaauensis]BCS19939.1 hypothetical protein APUU_20371S [Aspergillus puulaauensis]
MLTLRRSQGYGSLMIWIRKIRNGLHYQDHYTPSDGSCQSNWTESAITVGGGYIWRDVYAFSAKHGRIVVGGDDRTVGSIGGYLQGGGHGPASHTFGLATDQVLEYQVVLASGELVTANVCQNIDLFTALRGGGGGTFGVVVSATIKAYKTRPVLVHQAEIVPLNTGGNGKNALLNVTAELLARFPTLLDAGFAGYVKLVQAGEQRVYQHVLVNLLESNTSAAVQHATHIMQKQAFEDLLLPLNGTSIFVKSSFQFAPTFADYTTGVGNKQDEAGSGLIMASRFFDKKSLHNQQESLLDMLHIMFSQNGTGATPSASMLDLGLIGGGKVLESAPHTSVNPAWRKTYGLVRYIDIWPDNADLREIQQIKDGVTFKKLDAMKALTPGMGAYLNEADGDNPEWKEDWFGSKYDWLESVKDKYDPEGVFWCWRCVGSEGWEEVKGGTVYGPLCKV